MAGQISNVLKAYVDEIALAVPNLRTVKIHSGRFDDVEIGKTSFRCPAVFVSLLGVPKVEKRTGGPGSYDCYFAAFCLTDGRPGDRDVACIDLTETITSTIVGFEFGGNDAFKGVSEATDIKSDNLFSGKIGDRALAIYGIMWKHQIIIGEKVFPQDDEPWTETDEYFVEYNEDPAIELDPDNAVLLEPADAPD